MSSIEQKYQEIQKEMSVDYEGKITFTMRGGARLIGLAENTLINRFNTDHVSNSALAKKLTEHGFDVLTFAQNGIPDAAMAIIASYYAFDAGKHCKQEAKDALVAFSAVGIRAWGQKLLGWKSSEDDFKQQVLTSLAILTKEIKELQPLKAEVIALRPIVQEYQKINQALVDLKQLKPLLEQISEELKLNPNQRKDKLAHWLKEIGMSQLSSGKRKALGRLVSDFLKVGNLQPPAKSKGITQYPESMKPLIELASRHLV